MSERAAEAAVVQLSLHLDVNPEMTLAALAEAVDVLVLGAGSFFTAVHNSILALFRGQEDCGRADATAFAIGFFSRSTPQLLRYNNLSRVPAAAKVLQC